MPERGPIRRSHKIRSRVRRAVDAQPESSQRVRADGLHTAAEAAAASDEGPESGVRGARVRDRVQRNHPAHQALPEAADSRGEGGVLPPADLHPLSEVSRPGDLVRDESAQRTQGSRTRFFVPIKIVCRFVGFSDGEKGSTVQQVGAHLHWNKERALLQ